MANPGMIFSMIVLQNYLKLNWEFNASYKSFNNNALLVNVFIILETNIEMKHYSMKVTFAAVDFKGFSAV